MATHILTVDETTFKTHLEFMFIGTGKNDSAHQSGALADILSIRENDEIIFYVMKKGFFGVFKALGGVFYDYSSYEEFHPQYLDHLLGGKTLTYRMEIKPKEVYQRFISEWDMMENPAKIPDHSIFNMQWSWIFKKLKGNRGCISIDSYEYELFRSSLVENNFLLPKDVKNYTYRESEIHVLNNELIYEEECKKIPPRNEERLSSIRTEVDLRIMFTSQGNCNDLLNIILKPEKHGKINFIANEIACSFSERKMDLLFGTDQNKCLLIELKNTFIYSESIYNQIKEYARWISAYKTHYKNITPILLIKAPRKLAPSRKGKYFKYLSEQNMRSDDTSIWFKDIIQNIKSGKENLTNEKIPRLNDLEVYLFETDETQKLISIEQIF